MKFCKHLERDNSANNLKKKLEFTKKHLKPHNLDYANVNLRVSKYE